MDKINNKNAREKALLEEAYGSVYSEDTQKPRIASSRDENGREVFHVLDKHGKSVYKVGSFKQAEWWLREYYDILMAEDEQNPNADTYDAQGRKLGIVAALEGEEDESREERADVDRYEYEQGKEAGERDVTTKFQPGQFVDVLGDDGEFSHQEVVLNVTGDVVNTIRVVGDGKPYGDTAKGYYDINLISPQDLESGKYSADFKPADGREW